ncbi:MAG: hypothetical protein R3F19_32830 [Verrucomicrobiales bacterium]
MSKPKIHEFTVPIDENHEGMMVVLWPCDGIVLQQYVKERFGLDPGDRDSWDGRCYSSQALDDKAGHPFVVMALRNWDLNLKDPPYRESNADKLSLLAHECFHAAEWMLKQTGFAPPVIEAGDEWEAWEDAAYLLQRIMRRTLEGMLES